MRGSERSGVATSSCSCCAYSWSQEVLLQLQRARAECRPHIALRLLDASRGHGRAEQSALCKRATEVA